jgi:hypothetical protein
MKNPFQRLGTLLTLAALLVGCSKNGSSGSANPANGPAPLPVSWTRLPENGGNSQYETPSTAADASVRSAFRAHTRALEAALTGVTPLAADPANAGDHPANWVPWHLQGLIGNFSVTANGLFGPLLFGGTASVKGTWDKEAVAAKRHSPAPSKARTVHFSPRMTAQDLAARLEPIVRTALDSGSVTNEQALRQNLTARGQEFLTVVSALDTLPASGKWHVSAFQLQLSIFASGQVSTLVGVGGTLDVFFDWGRDNVDSQVAMLAKPYAATLPPTDLTRKAPEFVQTVQAVLGSLPPEATSIQQSGFVLEDFMLGIAVSVGGNIGIVQGSAEAQGKIVFEASEDALLRVVSQPLTPALSQRVIPIIARAKPEHLAFAEARNIAYEKRDDGTIAYSLDPGKFRDGIQTALKMGNYLATHARSADTAHFKLVEIETEFDASIQGDLKIVTVAGEGQLVLTFARKD